MLRCQQVHNTPPAYNISVISRHMVFLHSLQTHLQLYFLCYNAILKSFCYVIYYKFSCAESDGFRQNHFMSRCRGTFRRDKSDLKFHRYFTYRKEFATHVYFCSQVFLENKTSISLEFTDFIYGNKFCDNFFLVHIKQIYCMQTETGLQYTSKLFCSSQITLNLQTNENQCCVFLLLTFLPSSYRLKCDMISIQPIK